MIKQTLPILASCFLFYGCPNGECFDTPLLPYQGSFSVSPHIPIYQVGDTITFSSAIAIKDLFPDTEPTNYEVSSIVSVAHLDSIDAYPSANFYTTIVTGQQYPLTKIDSMQLLKRNLANFIYSKVNDSLLAVIHIELLRPGVFSFGPFSGGVKVFSRENCEQFSIFPIYLNGNNSYKLYESYFPELLIHSNQ